MTHTLDTTPLAGGLAGERFSRSGAAGPARALPGTAGQHDLTALRAYQRLAGSITDAALARRDPA